MYDSVNSSPLEQIARAAQFVTMYLGILCFLAKSTHDEDRIECINSTDHCRDP